MTRESAHTAHSKVESGKREHESGRVPDDREILPGSEDITTTSREEVDVSELPLGPQNAGAEPPRSGTVDDDDNRDDEREDENEAPTHEARDTQEAREEFRLDVREEVSDG
jgi:hypothetical protein